jgi:hypothetical protein
MQLAHAKLQLALVLPRIGRFPSSCHDAEAILPAYMGASQPLHSYRERLWALVDVARSLLVLCLP